MERPPFNRRLVSPSDVRRLLTASVSMVIGVPLVRRRMHPASTQSWCYRSHTARMIQSSTKTSVSAYSAFLDILNETTGIKPVDESKICPVLDSSDKHPGISPRFQRGSLQPNTRSRCHDPPGFLAIDPRELDFEDPEIDNFDCNDEILDWSHEANELKRLQSTYKKHSSEAQTGKRSQPPAPLTHQFLQAFLKSLRLVDRKIGDIDSKMLAFRNLTELSLTGNHLEAVGHLPKSLKTLHLNANRIQMMPFLGGLTALQHVGLAYNQIKAFRAASSTMSPKPRAGPRDLFPASLVSLDVSWNSLESLDEIVETLQGLPNLKALVLMGNPIGLFEHYRRQSIHGLQRLVSLDDVPVPVFEREGILRELASGLSMIRYREAALKLHVHDVEGLSPIEPVAPENPEQPPDRHFFNIDVVVTGYNKHRISTSLKEWTGEAVVMDFSKTVAFPVGKQLRDAFSVGVDVLLVRKKYVFKQEPKAVETNELSSSRPNSGDRLKSAGKGRLAVDKDKDKKKGGKAAAEEEAPWVPALHEVAVVAEGRLDTHIFLENQFVIKETIALSLCCDWTETEIPPAPVVRLSLQLHPQRTDAAHVSIPVDEDTVGLGGGEGPGCGSGPPPVDAEQSGAAQAHNRPPSSKPKKKK
ncbi:uncharacterized protein BJ171DRAFT_70145 [Polychytrium aggregatum]|uniref:uncharacterized protein n=1 Tax=Polychytrium aggregatum TaxID=110093 RepID=UPI0022FEC165|nr:uncharacterized protein BJ171DRAFT_70145 [Polychytrium aggregatum]KAI9205228.1 hypothetical protein BJ171DRAFT_70145 [Polychytrium aggregatum]